MSTGTRRILLFLPLAGFAALLSYAVTALPPSQAPPGPLSDVILRSVVGERHVTNAVSAVNFDYRALDTVGEESILFAAVIGATLLLRSLRREEHDRGDPSDPAEDRHVIPPSDAVRICALLLTGITVAFGLYIIAHGQLTPGGGFQGGVVLATVPLFVYLAGGRHALQNVASEKLVHWGEAVGIAGFIAMGLVGLIFGGAFLQNVVPLGPEDKIYSGGSIALVNLATGLAVAAGFVLLVHEFLGAPSKERDASHGDRP
jgi:multicomponent Na+:H+ antiporter subunit B